MKRTLEITMTVVYDDDDGRVNPIKMVKMDLADAMEPRGSLKATFFCSDSIEVGEPREITDRPKTPIIMG